jgi:ELWxxDGT repeat protein
MNNLNTGSLAKSVAFLSAVVLALLFSSQVFSQKATFIKDINSTPAGSFPSHYVVHNSELYFTADDDARGRELWKTDGTALGTTLVKDIRPGSGDAFLDSEEYAFISVGSFLYFSAFDGVHGIELWKTDGTELGTVMVKDIKSNNSFPNGDYITKFAAIGSTVYFVLETEEEGSEIWMSDGTEMGTVILDDINSGSEGSNPKYLTVLGSDLFFSADDGTDGIELWKSDGTEGNSTLVKDIHDSLGSEPRNLAVFGGNLYFGARDSANGFELWKSDGTEVGTNMLKDITGDSSNGNPGNFFEFSGHLYFSARTVDEGTELWKTDGTEGGTIMVEDINDGGDSFPRSFAVLGGSLFFVANDGVNGRQVWETDGSSTTELLKIVSEDDEDIPILLSDGANLYFYAYDDTNGFEPRISDGTNAGTSLLKDTVPENQEELIFNSFIAYNGLIYFSFIDDEEELEPFGAYGEPWSSDGTEEGTIQFIELNSKTGSSYPNNFTNLNGKLLLTANDGVHGDELWVSDGTATGTSLLKDINSGVEGSDIGVPITQYQRLHTANGLAYFFADDGVNGGEVWRTDGTIDGTIMLKDISSGGNPYAINFVTLDDDTFFAIDSTDNGASIWKTDGSIEGTVLLVGFDGSSIPANFFKDGNIFYFSASEFEGDMKLWKSDGTPEGTELLKDVSPDSSKGPFDFGKVGDSVVFVGYDDLGAEALWKTDGTSDGTIMVKGEFEHIQGGMLGFGADVFFFANYTELWKSDGSTDGTSLVKDISPAGDLDLSLPFDFVTTGNRAFFIVDDGVHGEEIWASDGTESGTMLLRDINDREGDSDVDDLLVVGNTVYFEANDDIHGEELWITNGTPQSTRLFKDVIPGVVSGDPDELALIGDWLYFEASDSVHGDELWRLNIGELCTVIRTTNAKIATICL